MIPSSVFFFGAGVRLLVNTNIVNFNLRTYLDENTNFNNDGPPQNITLVIGGSGVLGGIVETDGDYAFETGTIDIKHTVKVILKGSIIGKGGTGPAGPVGGGIQWCMNTGPTLQASRGGNGGSAMKLDRPIILEIRPSGKIGVGGGGGATSTGGYIAADCQTYDPTTFASIPGRQGGNGEGYLQVKTSGAVAVTAYAGWAGAPAGAYTIIGKGATGGALGEKGGGRNGNSAYNCNGGPAPSGNCCCWGGSGTATSGGNAGTWAINWNGYKDDSTLSNQGNIYGAQSTT